MTTPTPDYSLLDQAGAASSMFYPRPDFEPTPPGARDLEIEVAPGVVVAARHYVADTANPTLLYFHGNGEIASDHDGIAPLYHAIGLNLYVAEFRGYGRSSGVPTVASLIGDSHAVAARFHSDLDAQGTTAERYIMGRSLGAHPALELAANGAGRFAGLILESGAGSIRRMVERVGLLDTELGGRLALGHDEKIRSIRLPVLLIHGQMDDLVPLARAEEMHEALAGTTRQLEIIPRAGHNDLLWVGREQYFEAIRSFVFG